MSLINISTMMKSGLMISIIPPTLNVAILFTVELMLRGKVSARARVFLLHIDLHSYHPVRIYLISKVHENGELKTFCSQVAWIPLSQILLVFRRFSMILWKQSAASNFNFKFMFDIVLVVAFTNSFVELFVVASTSMKVGVCRFSLSVVRVKHHCMQSIVSSVDEN